MRDLSEYLPQLVETSYANCKHELIVNENRKGEVKYKRCAVCGKYFRQIPYKFKQRKDYILPVKQYLEAHPRAKIKTIQIALNISNTLASNIVRLLRTRMRCECGLPLCHVNPICADNKTAYVKFIPAKWVYAKRGGIQRSFKTKQEALDFKEKYEKATSADRAKLLHATG